MSSLPRHRSILGIYTCSSSATSSSKKVGDQYLGRVVSGLDVNNLSFAISPLYFECGDNEDDVREEILNLLKEFTVGGHGIRGEIF